MQEGDFAEGVQLDDGGLVALRLDEIVPATPIPFEETREAVTEGWRKDALHKALLARAEEIKTEVAAGANIGAYGIIDQAPEIARDGFVEGVPNTLLPAAFKLKKGEVGVVETPDYVGLVQVDDVMPAAADDADAKALKTAIAAQIEQGMAQDAFQLFSAGLAAQAGITINQAAIDAVHAQMR
ncbi:hypothetical protein ACFSHQ_19060 [Gemmobacter lanyuensis]